MLYITVPDMNDSVSTLSIDGVEYGLRFTYNEKYDYWSFGLYDENMEPIISQTRIVPCSLRCLLPYRIVPNFPIFHFYTESDIPKGIFGCISYLDTVGRNAFKDVTAEFVYIPTIELEDDN